MWKKLDRPVGCGLWLVALLGGLFVGEWVLLWMVVQVVPERWLIEGVFTVAVMTFIIGALTLYVRIQRRME